MPVTLKLKGIDREFAKKDKEVTRFVNEAMRARGLQALAALKETTPVDTGRARNSWTLTATSTEFRDAKTGNINSISPTMLSPVSEVKEEQLYITNGVNYIKRLNEGSSKQAPARFVERAISRYFNIVGIVYLEN